MSKRKGQPMTIGTMTTDSFIVTGDCSHLAALMASRSHERERLAIAKTPSEIAARTVWVRQYDKQIADEEKYLGFSPMPEISDDELMKELGI